MFRKDKKSKPSAEELMAEFLSKNTAKPSDNVYELEIKFTALWQLLQKKFGLSQEELEEEILSIKNKSKTPTKTEQKILKCPKCNRNVTAKTGFCIYCGKDE